MQLKKKFPTVVLSAGLAMSMQHLFLQLLRKVGRGELAGPVQVLLLDLLVAVGWGVRCRFPRSKVNRSVGWRLDDQILEGSLGRTRF
jgi:hypothetical protein